MANGGNLPRKFQLKRWSYPRLSLDLYLLDVLCIPPLKPGNSTIPWKLLRHVFLRLEWRASARMLRWWTDQLRLRAQTWDWYVMGYCLRFFQSQWFDYTFRLRLRSFLKVSYWCLHASISQLPSFYFSESYTRINL